MATEIVSMQQVIITVVFLSCLFGLLVFLRMKGGFIRANLQKGQRIKVIEETAVSLSERLRLISIDNREFCDVVRQEYSALSLSLCRAASPAGCSTIGIFPLVHLPLHFLISMTRRYPKRTPLLSPTTSCCGALRRNPHLKNHGPRKSPPLRQNLKAGERTDGSADTSLKTDDEPASFLACPGSAWLVLRAHPPRLWRQIIWPG